MGLLSRFGRGLTQAAPIMGQMAQASLLQAADEKKYNRLVEREELKHTRGLEASELAHERGVTSATIKAQVDYYKTRSEHQLELAMDAGDRIKSLMTKEPAMYGTPGASAEDVAAEVARLRQVEKTAMELYSEYDRQYRALADLPPLVKIDEEALTGSVDLEEAIDLAANEILQSTEVEGATGLINVPTIDSQIADINKKLESNNMAPLTEEQSSAFRSAVEGRIKVLGEPTMPEPEPKTDWREGVEGDPEREDIKLNFAQRRIVQSRSNSEAKKLGKKSLKVSDLVKLIQQELLGEEIQQFIDDGYHIPEWYQTVLLSRDVEGAPSFAFGKIESLDALSKRSAADMIRDIESDIGSGLRIERDGQLYDQGSPELERLLEGDVTREKIRKYNPELTMQMMDLFSNSTRTV